MALPAVNTEVGICNLALANIGVEVVTSTSGNVVDVASSTPEGVAVRLWYPVLRDKALSRHFWSFAERRKTFTVDDAANATLDGEWTYAYFLPPDYLALEKVNSFPASTISTSWQVEGNKILYLNSATPDILYTYRNEDVTTWPAEFSDALSLLLSSRISRSINGSVRQMREYDMAYKQAIGEAVVSDFRMKPEGERGVYGAVADSRFRRSRRAGRLG